MSKIKEVFIHTDCTDSAAAKFINEAVQMYTDEDGYEVNYDIMPQDNPVGTRQLLTVLIEVSEKEEEY